VRRVASRGMWRNALLAAALAALLAGCSLGDHDGAAEHHGRLGAVYELDRLTAADAESAPLTIRLLEIKSGRVKVARVRQLRCTPPGGSVTDPVAACRALQDLLHYRRPRHERFCGRNANGQQIVEIIGRVNGQRVGRALITKPGRCQIGPRWMRDIRALTA